MGAKSPSQSLQGQVVGKIDWPGCWQKQIFSKHSFFIDIFDLKCIVMTP